MLNRDKVIGEWRDRGYHLTILSALSLTGNTTPSLSSQLTCFTCLRHGDDLGTVMSTLLCNETLQCDH